MLSIDAENNSAPRWLCRETHHVVAADLCVLWKERRKNLGVWPEKFNTLLIEL